jgi:type I restriction enzyme S subunit
MNNTVPDGWAVKGIGELVTLKYGKSPKEIFDDDGKYPVIGTGGVTGTTSSYLHEGGTTVIGRKGTINKPSYVDGRFWAIDTTYFGEKYRDADPKWFYYSLSSFDLAKYNEASGVPSLNRDTLNAIQILKPPLPEQQKIATILSSVDNVIETTRAQIDKLKDLKTGMMQELLTKGIGHTEFKDSPVGRIPAGWEVSSLDQLVTIKHGYAFEGAYFRSVPTPYLLLTPGNFNKDGRLYFGPKTKYYDGPVPDDFILKNGDVLVVMTDLTKEMTILGNTIILKSPNTVLHNQRIGKVVSLKENVLSPDYLCMVMNSDRVKSHIKDTATGTTVRHTSPTKILEPLIPIPSISEQAKITDIFRSLNNKVALVESKLAAHKIIKKALMQDLLTGKVRVQVDTRELADA